MTTALATISLLLVLASLCWRLYAEERAIRREHRHLTTGRYEIGKHVKARRKDDERRPTGEHDEG